MNRLRALWARLRRWWADPFPAELGREEREGQRRIPIELVFILAADGKVYHRRRKQDGDRRVDDPVIIAMVHTEYRWLVRQARRRARVHGIKGRTT